MIYTVIISCTCGCEWRLSCMPPWQVTSPMCLGNGASPQGPKFGISILCGNGPPFAACHHKIGSLVLARVPPAEWGLVFLLCSMTPLILPVDFLSLFLGCSLSLFLFHYFSSSRKALQKPADYNHIPSEKVHFVIRCH